MCTTHTSKSHSRVGSHVSQRQDNNKALQREIDDLKKKLRRAQRKWSPSSSDTSSNDKGDDNIGKGQEPHQVRPFLMRKSTTINADTKLRPVRA